MFNNTRVLLLHQQRKRRNKMTNSEKFAAVSKTTFGNNLFDGEWMIEAVETQETLDQFNESKKEWNEYSGRVEGDVAGFKFLGWSSVQMKKGDARRSLTVIDFGNFRIALDFDPKFLND